MQVGKLTFCFRRLQDSHACAVRIRLSSGTFGLVMMRESPFSDQVKAGRAGLGRETTWA